ncbi:HAMP domain-containing sensor histidine kinase [Nocardioides sp. TF02-7]|uniref:sensor histidine kinase n=1 Tax=Nocardioides sp. TF02-7 TaxID=2917724 RepID=UPI001F0591C6|nr:HAMP domain-containing sensor histidine kinase [Nocardioides sp. TF02-7]UMG92383.1 HAMP domain-containing histidine kinase [Nocardioides sp. TF02-7]
MAPVLAAAGADLAWCEQVFGIAGAAALDPALHWVANSLATDALLAEVKEATGRVSSLVAAVKSYSQLDRASMQSTDVTDGLESTLMVLGHALRGITVVRDYEPDLPRIEAVAGELNQVWTNLISNAADAMGDSGTLRVAAQSADGAVVVEVADTGPGIPADVLPRVFEPFFTTKEVGHGTGLGLDISRRIVVDRHGGSIDVERSGGETVFRVRLPCSSTPAP